MTYRLAFQIFKKIPDFDEYSESMDVERVAVFASVGFAIAVAAFVLWGPSPKPRKKGKIKMPPICKSYKNKLYITLPIFFFRKNHWNQ